MLSGVASGGTGTLLTTTVVAGSGDAMQGIVFAKGATTGCDNVATSDGFVSVYQINGVSTWDDGSCRFALAAYHTTGAGTIHWVTGTSPANGTPSCATLEAATPAASVAFTGGISGTANLSSLFGSAKVIWASGPALKDCVYWTTLPYTGSQIRVAFDVRYYPGSGNKRTRVLVDNGGWADLSQTDQTAAPVVTINGTTAYNPGSITVYAWAGFNAMNAASPEVAVTPNPGDIMATKLMPNLNVNFAPTAAALNALPQNYVPYSQAYYHDNMEATGGTPYIGWTQGGPDNLYFTSGGDSRALSSIVTTALALQTYPHRCFDHANGDGLLLPSLNASGHCGGTGGWGTPYPSSSQIGHNDSPPGNIQWDQAHHPSSGYACLILTGEYACYEELEATALASGFLACCGHAANFPTRDWTSYQTRGQSWATRDVEQFLALSPANQMKTDLTTEMTFALAQYVGNVGANPLGIFFSHEVEANDYGPGLGAPWQNDFWTISLEAGIDLDVLSGTGATNLATLAAESSKFSIGRANGNGTGSGGCYSQSASYNGQYASTTTSSYSSPPYEASYNAYWLATAPTYVAGAPCTNTLNGGNIGDPESYWAVESDAVNRGYDHSRANAAAVLSLWSGASCYARGSCGTSTVQDSVTGNEIPFGYTHRMMRPANDNRRRNVRPRVATLRPRRRAA